MNQVLDSRVSIQSSNEPTRNSLPSILRFFAIGSGVLTFLALATRFACRHVFHLYSYPYALYLLPRDGDGLDLTCFKLRFLYLHSSSFFLPQFGTRWAYPAGTAPIFWLFYLFRKPAYPFLVVGPLFVLLLAWLLLRALRRHGLTERASFLFVTASLIFSYPLYFEFNRANMELFCWLVSGVAVYCLLSGRSWLGAALIGVAAAFKIFPIVFAGILLARKQYWQAALAVAVAGLWTLVTLWMLCPDVVASWKGTQAGMQWFSSKFAAYNLPVYAGVDHSLYGLIKRSCTALIDGRNAAALKAYNAAIGVTGLLLFFLRIRKLPVLNQVTCLTVAAVLFPPMSFDYTLVDLYIPWALLVLYAIEADRTGRRIPGLNSMFACLLLLMAQVGEIILHGDRLGGQIKAVALCVLFFLALRHPLPDDRWDAGLFRGTVPPAPYEHGLA